MEKYTSQQPQTFKTKLENFWFYHKWHVLAVILILCITFISVKSCVNKKSYDMYVLYMVGGGYSLEANENLSEKFENYVDDVDGDGEKRVQIITINFADVSGQGTLAQETAFTKMISQVSSGSALFYVFDDTAYQALKNAQVKILDDINTDSPYVEGDRFNAKKAGFFDDVEEWDENKDFYFGIRVSGGIKETESRFAQIKQSRDTLQKIILEYK